MTMPSADGAPVAPGKVATRTIASARRAVTTQLRAMGIDTPELDARILVGHALGLDHAALAAAGARELAAEDVNAIAALARRRLAGEPIARILGYKEFWSLPLSIGAATLVPRPETETVVEAALAAIEERGGRARPLRILDIGTGCGAIILALVSELPNAFGIGSDISLDAVDIARRNARRLNFTRVGFVACDMATALAGRFEIIVSNPPYIASGDIAGLAPEVREFDPRRALDGGTDGLDFYRRIAAHAPALLARDGALVVEVGLGQAAAVAALLAAAGLAPSTPRPDLNGVPRALLATRGHDGGALGPGKKALGMSAGTD
jgi:release factor glutamine methyltransferase